MDTSGFALSMTRCVSMTKFRVLFEFFVDCHAVFCKSAHNDEVLPKNSAKMTKFYTFYNLNK